MNSIQSDGMNSQSKWQRSIDEYLWPGSVEIKESSKLRSIIHMTWHCVSLLYAKLRCKLGRFDKMRIRHHYNIVIKH